MSDELTYDRIMSRVQSSNRTRQLYRLAFESVIDSDDKKWEAIYKNIDGDEARFYSDGMSIKMKKATA